jgi:hypothetical protein
VDSRKRYAVGGLHPRTQSVLQVRFLLKTRNHTEIKDITDVDFRLDLIYH